MPYERDPVVLGWLERMLTDPRPRVRTKAVALLEHVACDDRDAWLTRAQCDGDPKVVAAAVMVEAVVRAEADSGMLELYESELGEGVDDGDLCWEWEYTVKVCRGTIVPELPHLVWTKDEDDAAAKSIALIKAFGRADSNNDAVAVIVAKRLVNQYTRSARTMVEAIQWHRDGGRPRYHEQGGGSHE